MAGISRYFSGRFPTVLGYIAAAGVSLAGEAEFTARVQPLLEKYCYDCHADGSDKGNVVFDAFKSHAERTADHGFWLNVLRNLRAEVMPPAKKDQPSASELALIEGWIKSDVFKIDPADPDPGRVTLRRLNRVEYQNTIRDLMGVEFRAFEEFPPDDTGYGFDNIGDVLTTSPLLLEKYMDAAEVIVAEAVPVVSLVVDQQRAEGAEFRSADGRIDGRNISFYQPATISRVFKTGEPGEYRLLLEANVSGAFDFDPGRMKLTVRLGDEVLLEEEHRWQDGKKVNHEFSRQLPAGEHRVSLTLEPLVPEEQKKTRVDFRLRSITLQGPLAPELRVHPPNYERFFSRAEPPVDSTQRRQYASEVLGRFATRAFRRPVDDRTVARLAAIAEDACSQPGKSFEAGVARAMVAVLASPRFLFRTEGVEPTATAGQHPNLDEHSLASRLSYFLWSTMPDAELTELAARGELRKNLKAQVDRLLADQRSNQFVENFVGQWLLARDVEGISINERSVLDRDSGQDRAQEKVRERFNALREIPADQITPEQQKELDAVRAAFRRRRDATVELNGDLRRAMRRETELTFNHILRDNRSITELLDANYTFLNERLARHYGVAEVKGDEFRQVTLPANSPRGGILTHGSVLVVTSNPTRTSPVKRGVFLLDQILGTPAPPPPPDVPDLELAEKEFKDREPTLRETLELHRSNALCKSCHNRMDPLGLALENFNALGMWRETERGHHVDPAGSLITGETFTDIRELKRILATERRLDFYRCLTGKLMTYALGRGMEYNDTQALDGIVQRLQREDGRFSALLLGVIESAPFQKRRSDRDLAGSDPVQK